MNEAISTGWDSFAGFIAMYFGWFVLIGIVLLAWSLMTTHKKGVLFVLGFVFIIAPLIFRFAPGQWMGAAISGTDDAQSRACERWGKTNPKLCEGLGGASTSSNKTNDGSGSGGGANDGDGSGGGANDGGGSSAPLVTRRLRQDALAIWVGNLSTQPSDWLDNASTNLLPKGIACDVTGTGDKKKQNEVWNWVCFSVNPALDVTSTEFTANGYFTRDSKSWGISSSPGEAKGTGSWESCSECWEVITQSPAASPTPPPSYAEASPTPPPSYAEASPTASAANTSFAGCPSSWAPNGTWPAGTQHTQQTNLYCIQGQWVTLDVFTSMTGGLTPAQVLAGQ